mmetsp:Transcript_8318/g.18153  ORF Transcript_8318/g.18153 Transcript_8318/m.18153 type:complete len:533 (-) Transcript_8318:47-1645(-)
MNSDWYPVYTPHKLKTGLAHCAQHSVAFHYVKGDLMRRIHAILYGLCKEEKPNEALQGLEILDPDEQLDPDEESDPNENLDPDQELDPNEKLDSNEELDPNDSNEELDPNDEKDPNDEQDPNAEVPDEKDTHDDPDEEEGLNEEEPGEEEPNEKVSNDEAQDVKDPNEDKEEDLNEYVDDDEKLDKNEDNAHPHMGAKDAQGKLGYVHDPTALKRDPPDFDTSNLTILCKPGGAKGLGDADWKMLSKKVEVDFAGHKMAEDLVEHGSPRVKIFCVVYTIEESHGRVPAILETWGQKCDGFMVASTKTVPELQTVEIPHEGDEAYQNIWQKVRSIWSYVYDNYYNDFDFFHIGGDDLYVIVENLRLYLESDEILKLAGGDTYPKPVFLGRRFQEQGKPSLMFNSGGSGYTLNKASLKALVVDQMPKDGICGPNLRTFAEDVMVARCFRHMGLVPYDTRDDTEAERYMPFTPGAHYTYRPPKDISMNSDWYPVYTPHKLKTGLAHCAQHSVAFHYVKGDLMRRIHAILYGLCKE